MNNNFTTTELLIQYLDDELEGAEKEAIKKNIDEDMAVQEEFENLRLAKEAMKSYGLKTKVAGIHTAMMSELKTDASPRAGVVRSMLMYSLRIAAIAVFVAGSFTLYQYFTASPQKLFSENFHAFNLHETRGSSSASPLADAYKKENIQEVILLYSQLKDPQAEDLFLTGNAFLSTSQPSKAIESFIALQQKNKTNNTHLFEEDAEYYLALSYVGNNETAKAIPIFEKINADKDHPYHQKVSSWFLIKLKHLNPER